MNLTKNVAERVEELCSLEDFFQLFNVEYDENLLQHSRVKLSSLFNKNLHEFNEPFTWDNYHSALSKAYCLLQHGVVVPLAGSACASCKSSC